MNWRLIITAGAACARAACRRSALAKSASIEVPKDIDTIVSELQLMGYWNGWAALALCIAAACSI